MNVRVCMFVSLCVLVLCVAHFLSGLSFLDTPPAAFLTPEKDASSTAAADRLFFDIVYLVHHVQLRF
jgi:hypothetical protein